jgi:hypothetical protein
MSIAKQKIKAVADQIANSDLRQSHKNDIQDMLIATGDATNGVSDKQQALTEAVAALGICFARDAICRRDDFRELLAKALETHTKNCPLVISGAQTDTTMTIVQGHGIKAQGKPSTVLIVSGLATVCWLAFLAAKTGGVL